MVATPALVREFWYTELTPKDHYTKSDEIDAKIHDRFLSAHTMLVDELGSSPAAGGHAWTQNALDTLAAIIVLDQFSRNLFRDTPASFGSDNLALGLAKMCVDKGWDAEIEGSKRSFFYLPFMHSENAADQARCVTLFKALGSEEGVDFAQRHQVIIDRFGRFPHRNAILGRDSTAEEIEFLEGPNSSF